MKPYLIFNLNNIKYGIDPLVVKEIFLLPELMPIAETPMDIVGILNLRGQVIPVMHLDLRLGGSFSECQYHCPRTRRFNPWHDCGHCSGSNDY